jgi:hypothetical protein
MSVILKKAIIAELRKRFLEVKDDFLAEIKPYDELVDNDTINFNKLGALPDVVVDTAGPYTPVARTDDGIIKSLNRLDTISTKVTDQELHALAYDKISSVREDHLTALKLKRIVMALWNLAPAADAASTPVFKTTGAVYGTRKRMKLDDLINFRELVVKDLQSDDELIMNLCQEHVHDLMLVDQSFRDRFNNTASGQLISQIEGFKMYANMNSPVYNNTTYAKKAIGAAAAGTDTKASVFFTKKNVMRCTGSVDVYFQAASTDPVNRQSLFGAAVYNLVSPIETGKGYGVIIGDASA